MSYTTPTLDGPPEDAWSGGWPYHWPDGLTVGWWYSVCCEHDLYQITSDEDLAEIRADYDADHEEGWLGNWWHFWPTREAALADPFLATRGTTGVQPPAGAEPDAG